MKFSKTLAATKSVTILAVIAGLAVDANGYYLSEEQMQAVEDNLTASEAAAASHATAFEAVNGQLTAANTATEAAQTELATANAAIAAKDTEIAGLQAQVAKLEKGTEPPKLTNAKADKTGTARAAAINPMNALADALLGAPKEDKA